MKSRFKATSPANAAFAPTQLGQRADLIMNRIALMNIA
jgi:hypothetical protein